MNKDQLKQQLDRLGERIASQPSIVEAVMRGVETMQAPVPGRRLGRIVMKTTMAIAASVMIGMMAWLALPLAGTPAYGIEDMPRRMLQIKGLHVKGWFTPAMADASAPDTPRMPVEFYCERPGRYWLTHYYGSDSRIAQQMYSDGRRYMVVDPASKTCVTGEEIPVAAELKVEQMLQVLVSEELLGGLSAKYSKAGTQVVNGLQVDVYEYVQPKASAEQTRIVLYLNPATGLPLQVVVHKQVEGQPERAVASLTDMEPNVSIPADLLSFDPPAGFTVVQRDRQPDDIGGTVMYRSAEIKVVSRFAFNIDDRAILLCWAYYDKSQSPAAEPDLGGPAGRRLELTPVSQIPGRTYGNYILREDPADEFHWRWSLIVPEQPGAQLDGDEPRLAIKNKHGGGVKWTIQPLRMSSRDRLADIVARTQRLTLPADAPTDAIFTLEQIEAMVAEGSAAP